MEIGSIFIIGFVSALISDLPENYFARVLPPLVIPYISLLLRYAGFITMIGDFSITYLQKTSTIEEYLFFSIIPTIVWILRSIHDAHGPDHVARRVNYSLIGSLSSCFFIIIGISIALRIIVQIYA